MKKLYISALLTFLFFSSGQAQALSCMALPHNEQERKEAFKQTYEQTPLIISGTVKDSKATSGTTTSTTSNGLQVISMNPGNRKRTATLVVDKVWQGDVSVGDEITVNNDGMWGLSYKKDGRYLSFLYQDAKTDNYNNRLCQTYTGVLSKSRTKGYISWLKEIKQQENQQAKEAKKQKRLQKKIDALNKKSARQTQKIKNLKKKAQRTLDNIGKTKNSKKLTRLTAEYATLKRQIRQAVQKRKKITRKAKALQTKLAQFDAKLVSQAQGPQES